MDGIEYLRRRHPSRASDPNPIAIVAAVIRHTVSPLVQGLTGAKIKRAAPHTYPAIPSSVYIAFLPVEVR
jgi:hypothetical protein